MRGRIASNVVWNWVGMAVTVLTGFVVAPYLVTRLGDTTYGLWILIASVSGYFGLLDLGVRGSVGRYVAFYRARDEHEEVNRSLSTSLMILTGVAVLALLATLLVLQVFFRIFEVPPEHIPVARTAILIIGINLALTFPITVFDGVLWGFERFDLLNMVDIPTALLRTGLTFALVHGPEDIAALAWITLITTTGNELVKGVMSFAIERRLRVSVGRFSLVHLKQLYGYGFWQFLLQIARQTGMQVGPLIVGVVVSVAAVTPFSIASRVLQYAGGFMVAATGVMTPLATALHARSERAREQQMFLDGGKWCTAFALLMVWGLLMLGRPFMALWVGADIADDAIPVLVVLMLGEALAMSQWLTFSMLLGKAKHRALAIASVAEGALAGVGGAIAAYYWGMVGVGIAFGSAAMLCRGVFQVVYGSRLMEVSLTRYLLHSLAVPAVVALPPCGILAAVVWFHEPQNWGELAAYSVGFAGIYVLNAYLLLWRGRQADDALEEGTVQWIGQEVEKVHG